MSSHTTKCPACGYALGGEIPDADLGEKKEADTGVEISDPDYQLPVYEGENAKAKAEEAARAKSQDEFAMALKRRNRRGTP